MITHGPAAYEQPSSSTATGSMVEVLIDRLAGSRIVSKERTVAAIDVGTTKICTLVGEHDRDGELTIVGVGTCKSDGLHKGIVVDRVKTVASITESVNMAQRLCGRRIESAFVGVAGGHISSFNHQGVVAISPNERRITQRDKERAIEAAQAVVIPNNRDIIHTIPRGYLVDGQEGIKDPLGLTGFRLEVDAHIVTASRSSIYNLTSCVQDAGVTVDELVLQPLASSEAVLTAQDKKLGVVLVDIGGGTTDVCIFVDGAISYSVVLPVGGNHVTRDVAHGLRLPFDAAEDVKVRYGNAMPMAIDEEELIEVATFDPEETEKVSRRLLAEVIEARMEEIFQMVRDEIRKSGFDRMLPGGVVLTGGAAELAGARELAKEVLDLPVRIGGPRDLRGLAESVSRPAYATAVGLLAWGLNRPIIEEEEVPAQSPRRLDAIYERMRRMIRDFF